MGFFDQSFRVFTLAGITVRVHIFFLLWILFRLFQAQGDWYGTLLWMGMLFGVVLLHEFGHCFGARAVGGDAHNIVMWPLGGLAFAEAPMRPWPQFVTVACGPLVNVGLCLLSALVLIVATGRPDVVTLNPWSAFNVFSMSATWHIYVGLFYNINLALLYFNLLPIYPLDGGQILWTVLWPFTGLHNATRLAAQLGLVGAVLLGMWGMSGGGGMLVAIAIFGGLTCFQRLQALRQGAFLPEEFSTYDRVGRYRRGGGLWSRLWGRMRSRLRPDRAPANPNPGGWEARSTAQEQLEAEVDRILKKVHEHGINSLTYVERQTLEHATRARRKHEQQVRGP